MERHNSSALEVAKFLEAHPKVIKVSHPLLPSSPYQTLASRQNGGRHSGMIAFYLDGGREEAVKFLDRIRIVQRAASLGGTHSLACHPCSLTHVMVIKGVKGGEFCIKKGKGQVLEQTVSVLFSITMP